MACLLTPAARLLLTALGLASVTLALTGCGGAAAAGGTQRVTLGGAAFTLELALDKGARHLGLSHRKHIAADGGMLFVFAREKQQAFVMRDCFVPLDIAFLNDAGRVLNTFTMAVEPPGTPEDELRRYPSDGRASLVIEVAGGTFGRLGVKAGDRVDLPVRELKRRVR